MKKIIFTFMVIVSTIFVSCSASTEVRVIGVSTGEASLEATFTDFFDPVEIVHLTKDSISSAIVMDKNTGVLYVRKDSGYKWGMSPIYDSDGSVLTKEKWLAKRSEKKE